MYITRILVAGLLLAVSNVSYALAEDKKWSGHVEVEFRKGNDRNIAESEFFIPVWQDQDSLVFTNIRGLLDNRDGEEGNFGFGVRQILDGTYLGQQWLVGGYGFFDVRNTEADNTFYQGTLGFEALSEKWDFRTNLYIPETSEQRVPGTQNVAATVSGTQLRITGTGEVKERALPGFDAELGFKLPVFETQIDEVRLYGGGFHFDADDYDNISGPRARMELRWEDVPYFGEGSRFTLGAEVQHDDVRDVTAFGIARLRIPFSTFTKKSSSRKSLSALERRMTESIVRDVDIVAGTQNEGEPVNEPATISINGTAVTDVTVLDATDNVPVAVAAAGAGANIILDGSQGDIVLAAPLAVVTNQNITGGGIVVTGAQSGFAATLGTRPTLMDGGVAGNLIDFSFDNNVTVQNLDVTADAVGPIFSMNNSDAIFTNINTTGGQIAFSTFQSVLTITNSQVSNTALAGLSMGFGSGTLNNVTVNNAGGNGVTTGFFTAAFNNVTVNNATLDSFLVTNAALSGTGNVSNNPGGTDCNDSGGNAGSFELNGGTCP